MIALLRGEVAVRRADHVVVLCGGVGYRLAVSGETLRHVPPVGEQTTLHVHLVVHNEAINLFGFASERERDLFLMLLSVQGVGPKVALGVLSAAPARELEAVLAAGDVMRLQAAPGVGKRTAERIVVELREKVVLGSGGVAAGVSGVAASDDPRTLARDGLLELGYTPLEAERLLARARGESPEELIAGALAAARAG